MFGKIVSFNALYMSLTGMILRITLRVFDHKPKNLNTGIDNSNTRKQQDIRFSPKNIKTHASQKKKLNPT